MKLWSLQDVSCFLRIPVKSLIMFYDISKTLSLIELGSHHPGQFY